MEQEEQISQTMAVQTKDRHGLQKGISCLHRRARPKEFTKWLQTAQMSG